MNPPENRRIDEHWTENSGAEFRYYGLELDEIVARNVSIHFECMGTGAWWMAITTPDGKEFNVNLGVKRTPRGPRKPNESRDLRWIEEHLTNWAFHELDI